MRQCPRCSSRYEDAVGFCPRDGTGLEEIKDSLIGQEVGHYKINSLIGEGGMGAVYLAVHPQIGSRVAVKVLHPELARDRAAVDRFFSEARSVNLIRHENIVNILDLAQLADGRSYIVMEYLEGESVASRLRKKGPFTVKEAVALMLPVLAGADIVAALDLKTDRKNRKLLVQKWSWVGAGAKRGGRKELKRRIEEELHRFQRFQLGE